MRDAMLALLAKEPAHGYELRQRIAAALGPAGEVLNPGQVYVTLARLVRSRLVQAEEVEQQDRPDKKVYDLTAAGRDRVAEWLSDVSWPKVAPIDFHLKLAAAADTGLADPISLVDTQRRELLRLLRDVQQLALTDPRNGSGSLLLEGVALRLQADIRWLEACERYWTERRSL